LGSGDLQAKVTLRNQGFSGGEATLGLTLTAVFQNKGDDAVAGDSRAESGDLIVVENTVSDRRWDERLSERPTLQIEFHHHEIAPRSAVYEACIPKDDDRTRSGAP